MTGWKRWVFLLLLCAVNVFAANNVDMEAWKLHFSDSLELTVNYPPDWKVEEQVGERPTLALTGPGETPGSMRAIHFLVQRRANVQQRPIDKWYGSHMMETKPLESRVARKTRVGGQPAMCREMTTGLQKQFDYFVSLPDGDVYLIKIKQPSPDAPLDPVYQAILGTIKFRPTKR